MFLTRCSRFSTVGIITDKAVEAGENLLFSPNVTFVHVSEDMFFAGWKMFQTFNDKKFSLTDCISILDYAILRYIDRTFV